MLYMVVNVIVIMDLLNYNHFIVFNTPRSFDFVSRSKTKKSKKYVYVNYTYSEWLDIHQI